MKRNDYGFVTYSTWAETYLLAGIIKEQDFSFVIPAKVVIQGASVNSRQSIFWRARSPVMLYPRIDPRRGDPYVVALGEAAW